ncbi:MAG: hypothetical protein A2156_09975 [Deltaproteobacteria bacterium RBG_16_48_10]|nr:MAG: hypothetical protein A2156_09975 [Deltaproteobacteria bacterium RBG_16_48_10]
MESHCFNFWEEKKEGFDRRFLLGLFLFAFLIRLPFLLYPEVIHNDGAEYVRQAKLILSGDWTGGKAPPLYPSLIAFARVILPDAEMAGILISVIFGALLILPIYYLGKEIFGKRVGILSSLIAAVHPFLTSSSGSVLTESTYYFLVAATVLLGWYAFQRGRIYEIVLFSLLCSLAYLTRPEGIGFLIVFSLWAMIVNPSDEIRVWTKRAGVVFLSILCFFLFSSPYIIQIQKETGRWGITKKFKILVASPSSENGTQSIEDFTKKKEVHLLSFVKDPLTVMKKIVVGFFQSLYKFQQGYHPLLFLFALLGLFFHREGSFSMKGNLYLFSYVVFFLGFILPFFWVTRRYTSQMIPIAIPWAAFGFLNITIWISRRLKEGIFQKKFQTLLLVILLLGLFIQGSVIHGRDFRLIQKEVGLWMRDHLPKGQKMMSKMGQESFYAEQAWVKMPEKSYEEILKEARTKGVRYLVIDENIEKDSPGFLEQSKNAELKSLFELRRKNRYMIVFEIVDPKGK